jgi:hypothetical protein
MRDMGKLTDDADLPPVVMPSCEIRKTLAGQKALVTGANSGIGKGVALALGKAGADVVVNYVGQSRAGRGGGGRDPPRGRQRLRPLRRRQPGGSGAGDVRPEMALKDWNTESFDSRPLIWVPGCRYRRPARTSGLRFRCIPQLDTSKNQWRMSAGCA